MKQQETEPTKCTNNSNTQQVGDTSLSNNKTTTDNSEHAGKWAVLAVVAIGVFMATFDLSIVNISLPAIASYFATPLNGAVSWVIIGYLVATATILLTAGRLSDMIGRKAVWIAGLILFTGSSALCGLAPSLAFLIAARAIKGWVEHF